MVDRSAGVPAPPAFAAASYLLADLDTGEVLLAKDAHGRYLPASTLKTLTVLTVLPDVDPRQVVTAERSDLVDGSKVGLDPGSHYTVGQLLQGTMLASGNDTATALARVAGGVPQTVARMQAEAVRLGARDTTVRNPSGLDAPGQLTSAYDLALIARAAMQLPAFRSLVTTKRVRFPGKEVKGKARTSFQIQNHNRLLYNYDGTIGVKDGYTIAARWTAISAVQRGSHRYLFTAMRRGEPSWRTQAAMFDWAFRYGPQVQPVGRLVEPGELERASTVTGEPRVAAAGRPASAALQAAGPTDGTLKVVGAGGVAAALLAVVLLALSARAKRRQVALARARRGARAASRR
ncbi:D-alanyl-D-alanine carboxypeptidase family protein [Angustibacter sp. Root456]|uniref:D-alanyl-D-alanine carboxypeptidase family protein n=1 Tax=Angustibacter sp. Root456 TaxID=1736539 RepID=UPI001F4910E0|nr:serine hydrolase [Angustibacter sp. Root456]